MGKHMLFVFASLFLVAGTVHAQSVTLKADVPFDFVVGNTILHAGAYTIQPMNVGGSVIELRNSNGKNGILLAPCTCASGRAEGESKLVFQVVDGRYFLWQIWTQGYDAGRELSIKHYEMLESTLVRTQRVVIPATITKA